jgi:hypothetical protein
MSEPYYRARYYDPNIGRFLSEDPIGFAGSGKNFYAYVGNSPVIFTDPSGMVGLQAATSQQLTNLISLFPNATLIYDGAQHPYLVVKMPCADVQNILEQNGYATANNWPDPHGWLFGNKHDHPTGTQARQKPGPDPSLNLHLILHDSAQCPSKTCTIDSIHNDSINPLIHPYEHLIFNWLPWKVGLGYQ